jgi:hypothetical protein
VPQARLFYRARPGLQECRMAKTIKLSLTEDEAEIVADALEVDMENYLEAAKEARGNNQRDDVKTFTEAAERIGTLLAKVRDHLED